MDAKQCRRILVRLIGAFCCFATGRAVLNVIENLFHNKSNQNVIEASQRSHLMCKTFQVQAEWARRVWWFSFYRMMPLMDRWRRVRWRDDPKSIMTFRNDCRHRSRSSSTHQHINTLLSLGSLHFCTYNHDGNGPMFIITFCGIDPSASITTGVKFARWRNVIRAVVSGRDVASSLYLWNEDGLY